MAATGGGRSRRIKVIISGCSSKGNRVASRVTSQMKLSPLIFSILFAACCQSMAGQDERFVEVPWANDKTLIYDLRTVHMVQPGRFTELIDKATDLRIRAEIKAGETLKRMALEGDRETGGRAGKRSQSATVKLSDLKISKSDSSRWQQALFDCKRGVWETRLHISGTGRKNAQRFWSRTSWGRNLLRAPMSLTRRPGVVWKPLVWPCQSLRIACYSSHAKDSDV
jgi:hypothetical protein